MRSYIGLIHKASDSEFGVTFPDFPGVTTTGATLDEARSAAQEALALHIAGLPANGKAMPAPSTSKTSCPIPTIATASSS